MSLTAIQLSITASFSELFERCAHEPMALLLDSCDHPQAQWDFIFRQPQQVFTSVGNWPTILDHALSQLPHYQGPEHLPFQGGLAGAWSYDAGRVLEVIPAIAANDIKLPELSVGLYTQALLRERSTGTTWLVAPRAELDTLKTYWEHPASAAVNTSPFQVSSTWQSNMTASEYARKFEQIQEHIRAGDCYQINLAQRFSAAYQGELWSAYRHLRQYNQAPFSAFLRLPQGALLSLSPERFLAFNASGHVETKPIKGTRPRASDPTQDLQLAQELQHSPKDRAENVMIVDLLRNDLSRLCLPGSVKVPHLFKIESYAAVHHLVSTVIGQLANPRDHIHLFAACFPGGSITGAPKISAMEIIDALEPHRRSYYCGCFGYFSQHGHADSNIAIRTLVATTADDQCGTLYCWAGGGIVADSNCTAEYQETYDKIARILPILTAKATQVTHESR